MNWVRERLQQFDQTLIAVNESGSVTYAEFTQNVDTWLNAIQTWNIMQGDRVGLISDYHINTVALLQALVETGCIVIPLSEDDRADFSERLEVACATKLLTVTDSNNIQPDTVTCEEVATESTDVHELMAPLVNEGKAGFVIYTSGTTGKSKAVLLDYERMVNKYQDKVRPSFRTLLFLKLDHIGGINTLFAVMFNGGTIVTSPSRQPKDICHCIEAFQVQLLPTTPSFLTMLLMSKMYEHYNFSSLKVVTYGTEVMPNSTLNGINKILPEVTLKQTYGLSELGILSTKSKDNSSRWMKIGGAGFELKVVDDVLWIKSKQAMLGYLNAPSPFDDEGWYNTGDKVEVDGEFFRILGRESEIINVAGEKVYPIEVESFLLEQENVRDVVVKAKKSPVTGQMVWAEFVLENEEEPIAFKKRITDLCQANLAPFKVPRLITIAKDDNVVGNRFKKIRKTKENSQPA